MQKRNLKIWLRWMVPSENLNFQNWPISSWISTQPQNSGINLKNNSKINLEERGRGHTLPHNSVWFSLNPEGCMTVLRFWTQILVIDSPLSLKFYWWIVDLQCCITFAEQQNDSVIYIHIYVYKFLFVFLSIMAYLRILNIVPCALQ